MNIHFTFKIYRLINKRVLDYSLGNSSQYLFTGGKFTKDTTCAYCKL